METTQNLTIDEIDDILDEIEERDADHNHDSSSIDTDDNFVYFNHDDKWGEIQSLDIELELMGLQQIPNFKGDFNQKALVHGYFIVNFMSYYTSLPIELINNIIDSCILFAFNGWNDDDDELIIMDDDEETSLSSDYTFDEAIVPSIAKMSIEIPDVCEQPDLMQFGYSQSPINLVTTPKSPFVYKPLNHQQFTANPLRFNYPSSIKDCTIINNGHTVQINLPSKKSKNNECTLFINNMYYTLQQFHFHIPSEHTIDNKQYEMEMHLVHVNEKENKLAVLGFIFTTNDKIAKYVKKPSLQLTNSRRHLVLPQPQSMILPKLLPRNSLHSISDTITIMQESEEEDIESDDDNKQDVDNDFLAQFWDELPMNADKKEILLTNPISFDYLFETSSNNFSKNIKTNEIEIEMEIFEYNGSLTTPPFTEGVQWLVSKKLHFMNKKQLNTLSSCWNNENNAREVQMYFGRKVSLRQKSSFSL